MSTVGRLEMELRAVIYDLNLSQEQLADRLQLLPVGVEVLFANPWDANVCFWIAEKLGITISFQVGASSRLDRFLSRLDHE